jgi:hypothetical protein
MASTTIFAQTLKMETSNRLKKYTAALVADTSTIDPERKALLQEAAVAIAAELRSHGTHATLFVCTHNSRRSHLADLWFRYAALHYGIAGLSSYSGGTEATAFNPRAIAAMERAGFSVHYDREAKNPLVQVSPLANPVWEVFSKVYTHEVNPKSNFTAIMVCSDADHNCPIVNGATQRFAIPYHDPKASDGTPSEAEAYDQAVKLIGTEMMYLAHQLNDTLR